MNQTQLDSLDSHETIIENMADKVSSVLDIGLDTSIAALVRAVLADEGLSEGLFLRRSFDGVSEVNWLVQKMIGEWLINRKVNT